MQVLQFTRLSARHAGMYLCKAEAHNPIYVRPTPLDQMVQSHFAESRPLQPSPAVTTRPSDPSSASTASSDGSINTEFLVQIQPIRLIVFSRPRMLPGNPRLMSNHHLIASHMLSTYPPTPPPPAWGPYPTMRQRQRVWKRDVEAGIPSWAYANRPVAREGEKMVLECAARGNPPPRLIWFKGGGGTSLPFPQSSIGGNGGTYNGLSPHRDEVNFDVAIREALKYLPIEEARKYLGTLVAEDSQILPAILEIGGEDPAKIATKISDVDTTLGPKEIDFSGTRLDRFSVVSGLRKDDKGKAVIAVSRLIVDNLRVSDATRYTCLAQLNMEQLGGHGNWTDVGRQV